MAYTDIGIILTFFFFFFFNLGFNSIAKILPADAFLVYTVIPPNPYTNTQLKGIYGNKGLVSVKWHEHLNNLLFVWLRSTCSGDGHAGRQLAERYILLWERVQQNAPMVPMRTMNATKAPTATPMITATGRDSVGKQNRAFYNNTAWAWPEDPATQTPHLTPEHISRPAPSWNKWESNVVSKRHLHLQGIYSKAISTAISFWRKHRNPQFTWKPGVAICRRANHRICLAHNTHLTCLECELCIGFYHSPWIIYILWLDVGVMWIPTIPWVFD